MQNRRHERDGFRGKCLSVLSVFLIVFLVFQLHYSTGKSEDPEEVEKSNLNVADKYNPVSSICRRLAKINSIFLISSSM